MRDRWALNLIASINWNGSSERIFSFHYCCGMWLILRLGYGVKPPHNDTVYLGYIGVFVIWSYTVLL